MRKKSRRVEELVQSGIPARLKDLRLKLALTGEEIAKILNISSKSWWRYEYGEAEPGILFLVRLVKIFKVSPLWLLTGEGEMFLEEKVVPVEDAPLVAIISFLRDVWKRGDQKERAWLEVQFSKCFPDFVEWRRMREEEEKKVVVKGD